MDSRIIDLDTPPLHWGRPVVTIGNFDGLHVGHRHIIGDCLERARQVSAPAAVVTFEPHPARVINPDASFCQLKTLEQRLRLIAAMGIERVAIVRFDERMRNCSPHQFIQQILVQTLAVAAVLVGPTFRFGHRREGDFSLLAALGATSGYVAHSYAPVSDGGMPVSSTRIRTALSEGEVEQAARLLGRPFRVEATIERGAGRGAGLGFPTANAASSACCLPGPGVYATRVEVRQATYRGASFIGEPQTFGTTRRVFETHILDWQGGDLYGEPIAVDFMRRLRDPQRFASPAELVAQLQQDVAAVRASLPLEGCRSRGSAVVT